jgi:hypothetical protein
MLFTYQVPACGHILFDSNLDTNYGAFALKSGCMSILYNGFFFLAGGIKTVSAADY